MFKKTITYTDFNGAEQTEDFYFHMSKGELLELELGSEGGFSEHLQRIVKANDRPQIVAEFKKIILMSYGERSDDGRRFIKNPQVLAEFQQTNAYSELFTELATNDKAAAEFINNLIDVAGIDRIKTVELSEPAKPKRPQDMTHEELLAAFQAKNTEVIAE